MLGIARRYATFSDFGKRGLPRRGLFLLVLVDYFELRVDDIALLFCRAASLRLSMWLRAGSGARRDISGGGIR